MKVTVTQENLNKALNIVSRVTSNKTSLPILSNILIKTENNRLMIAGTNLEIANICKIGAKVIEDGSLTVPAKLISEFVSNLPKNNIDMLVDGNKLVVVSGKYKSTINGILSDEFPALPTINSGINLMISGEDFKQAIQQTALTASHDDTRPVLTGILFYSLDDILYMVATDGYRLTEKKIMKTNKEINALIPASTMQEVARIIGEENKDIELTIDEVQVQFKVDEINIISRLISGKFPDYKKLIPEKTEILAKVEKEELIRITKIASLFARESGGSITIKTDSEQKNLSIHSIASQLGDNTSETNADVNESGVVTLNSKYLIDALGCFNGDEILFGFSGKLAPCVIEQTGDDNYQHIIMPLKS